jgi:hypothetical protein
LPSSVLVAGTGRPKTSTQNRLPRSFCHAFFAFSTCGLKTPSVQPLFDALLATKPESFNPTAGKVAQIVS